MSKKLTMKSLKEELERLKSGSISISVENKKYEVALELSKSINAITEMLKNDKIQAYIHNCTVSNSSESGIVIGAKPDLTLENCNFITTDRK